MNGTNSPEPQPISATKVRLLHRKGRPRVPLRQRMPAEKLKKGVFLIPSLFHCRQYHVWIFLYRIHF